MRDDATIAMIVMIVMSAMIVMICDDVWWFNVLPRNAGWVAAHFAFPALAKNCVQNFTIVRSFAPNRILNIDG